MKIKVLLLAVLLSVSGFSFSQSVSQSELDFVVKNFLKQNNQEELLSQKPEITKITIIKSDNNKHSFFYVVQYPAAYLIISADKKYNPIKAFSFSNSISLNKTDGISMLDILKTDYNNFDTFLKSNKNAATENQKKWQAILSNTYQKDNTEDQTFGPWLESIYGQVNCKNENNQVINVTNYYSPNNYAIGCVSIVFTGLMQYYQWPRKGMGSHEYQDKWGSSKGTYSANFEEKYYNWTLIKDKYHQVASTSQERSELGRLAYHAATSVNMEYEYNGSTSNINKIPNAARKHFRYSSVHMKKTDAGYWEKLDNNLKNGIPAQFAIYTSGGAGHAVICDGIKYRGTDIYYHLNMGWWGASNGWYNVRGSFNAGGYSNVPDAVLDFLPIPEMNKSLKYNTEKKSVELKWYYPDRLPAEKFELQIKKDVADWETLTDTLTGKSFVLETDGKTDYTVRVRAKQFGVWAENSYSNSISIKASSFTEKGDSKLSLYPSTVTDQIKISYADLPGTSVKIYNLSGTLVYQSEILTNKNHNVNLSALPAGLYIVKIHNDAEGNFAKFFKF